MNILEISDSTELDISFEEVKDIVKDTIDESKNLNDLIERVCKKIYFIGVRDAEVKMHKIQNKNESGASII